MAYCTIDNAKVVLQVKETEWDTEIEGCVASGSALADAFAKRSGLTIPSPIPQLVIDGAAHYAAWLFRRRRDPVSAEAFFKEAEFFMQKYVDGETAEGAVFKVVN